MENNKDVVVFALGELGKESIELNDINMGSYVTCINNPKGFNFMEGKSYYINGMGGLLYDDKRKEYYVGFGEDAEYGYALKGYNISFTEGEEETYIPHEILIRNFVYQMDYTPELMEMAKRHIRIVEVLE